MRGGPHPPAHDGHRLGEQRKALAEDIPIYTQGRSSIGGGGGYWEIQKHFRKLNVLHSPGTFLSNIQPRETKTCSQKPSQECAYGMDGGMLTPWNTNYSVIKRNGQ